jgi:hypothetical protein
LRNRHDGISNDFLFGGEWWDYYIAGIAVRRQLWKGLLDDEKAPINADSICDNSYMLSDIFDGNP